MVEFSKTLREEFDFVLMDCPAGIERGFENSIAAADEALVICTPEVSAVRDADRVIGLLYAKDVTPKLVVNRIVPEMVERGDMLSHTDMVDVLSVELVGLVEMDDQVVVATNTGLPLVMQKGSKAGMAFRRIAMRLNGNTDLPVQIPQAQGGIFKKLRNRFGLGK
jgi:septum site-determining protein MinD